MDPKRAIEWLRSAQTSIRVIEKMLKEESQAKICVRDELRKSQDAETQNELISFGPLGQRKVTHVGLTFDSICNSKKCVGDNSAWVTTCPGFVKR